VNILLIVNESPWGSTLAGAAVRFLEAAQSVGHRVPAVYFHGDGVYNALPGRVSDAGATDLTTAWCRLGRDHGVDLLLCSAAAARRFSAQVAESLEAPFREAGLAEMLQWAASCDRVVTF